VQTLSPYLKGLPLNIFGFGFQLPTVATLPQDIDELAQKYPPSQWQAPIIVAIDEAQRPTIKPDTPAAYALQAIHDGDRGLPISLVFIGLGNTKDRMESLSLTRVLNVHNLGSLTGHEPLSLMTDSCAHFGIDTSGFKDQLKELADPCEGWPQHLHIALKALGQSALATSGDLSQVNWKRIQEIAEVGRKRYYDSQYSRQMKESRSLTVRIMAELDQRCRYEEIIKLINECKADPSNYGFPEGMSASAFLTHLIHTGALQHVENDQFACPIPSFRTYLIERGTPLPGAACRGAPD